MNVQLFTLQRWLAKFVIALLSYDEVRMGTSLCVLKCFRGSDLMIIYNSSQTRNPDQ